MKNILLGNGINIEFGGKEYCNAEIIRRLLSNLQTKEYSKFFADKVNSKEVQEIFYGLHEELKSLLKGAYDKYCVTDDERNTLVRFKQQYTLCSSMFDIGMEDYFFLFRLFHNRFNDPKEMIKASFDGCCWLFFDAIYNDGRIQKVWEHISHTKLTDLRDTFTQFDNVFTVNYDQNVEMISQKPVHYLHGDFRTLLDQYDPNTLIGRMYQEQEISNPVTTDNGHIYCNGIMGFIGSFKEQQLEIFQNGSFGISQLSILMSQGLSSTDSAKIEQMRTSTDKNQRFGYNLIQTHKKYPGLIFHQYPYQKFKDISGELCIVGLSPNNDDHIWKLLKENSKLDKIVYYYKSDVDKTSINTLYSDMHIETKPVTEFW